jgi:hypothetical protein
LTIGKLAVIFDGSGAADVSPEPYVRAQAFALAVALVCLSLFGSALAALITSAVCAVVALYLRARYRGELLAVRAHVPPHRERLDRIVGGDLQTLLAAGITAGAIMLGFGVDGIDIGLARTTPLLVAVAAAAIYLSSLVDWFVILPRMTGMLGARPCRTQEARHPRFPHSWRETTRWWLVHRIVAALVLRFGLAFALTLTLHRYISMPGGTKIVAGALLGFLASYLKVIPAASFQAGHPTMVVGDTVHHAETARMPRQLRLFGRSINLPLKKAVAAGERSPREWVYDVALEGVDVVRADTREGEVPQTPEGAIAYVNRPRKILMRDIAGAEPADRPFSGCVGRCSGINWYCIENPRCFEPK